MGAEILNNHMSENSNGVDAKKLTFEQSEAIRKNAEAIARMAEPLGLSEQRIEQEITRARAGASYINGESDK